MEQLIFTNSANENITMGNDKPYLLKYISGTGGIETDVQMQKAPYQDGKTYIDSNTDERLITMNIVIMSTNEQERFQYRNQISRVFNPKLGKGTLKYVFEGGEKEIEVVVKTSPSFRTELIEMPEEQLETFITLIAPIPFWLDTFEESEEMADWIGGLSFNLVLPMSFAGRSSRESKIIHNSGNVDTPITFEFSGSATNPQIINVDTGEFIKVNKVIQSNEMLIITTAFGNKKVILKNTDTGVELNAFGYIDLESSFFQLKPGDNLMTYDADAGKENAKVRIKWRNRYVGV